MIYQLIGIICTLQMAIAAPQFVTFKDGNIGVNWGGYHADAGLGGLLTGNAAHGGLSASAGTPWGPRAATGINGGVDGRAAGGAYAGAEYNPSVGASSVISGSTGGSHQGFAGAEAHADGKVVSKSIGGASAASEEEIGHVQTSRPSVSVHKEYTHNIQKIKPPKKYSLIKHEPLTTPIQNSNLNEKTDIEPTVASHDHKSSFPSSTYTTKAVPVVPVEDHDGVIIVQQRQRERKHQNQQRRRLAVHPRRRAHKSELTRVTYVSPSVSKIEAATTAVPTAKTTFPSSNLKEGVKVHTPVSYSKVKTVQKSLLAPPPPPSPETHVYHDVGRKNIRVHGDVVQSALNIPIGILRSLQDSLGGLNLSKSVSYSKNY